MADVKMIKVEVAYARPDLQIIIPVEVPETATLEQALIWSRIQERCPEINSATAEVGIFGRLSTLSARLRPGDRIEIYRPLIANPKRVRKQRATAGTRTRKGARRG